MVQPHRNAKVSSAALRKVGEIKRGEKPSPDLAWQSRAFELTEAIGELGYLIHLKANVVAMADLLPQKWEPLTRQWTNADDPRVERVMASFVGPQGGQQELKRRAAFHLSTAGETVLLATPAPAPEPSLGTLPDRPDSHFGLLWEFLSTDELRLQRGQNPERRRDGSSAEEIPTEAYYARCWRSHGRFSDLADSEVRRVLGIAEEVLVLTQMVDAIAKCASEDTQILTADGWKSHDQLAVGELVLALDHVTGLTRWEPVEAVNRYERVDHPMLSIDAKNHSSLTTLNHRWPVLHRSSGRDHVADATRQWRQSDELSGLDQIVTAAPCSDLPIEAKHEDALVEMLAWFWTEGYARNGQIDITQSYAVNPHKVGSIRRALTALYGPGVPSMRRGKRGPAAWRESVHHDKRCVVFHLNQAASEPILDLAPDKVIDLAFIRSLTIAQLNLFIEKSIDADGTRAATGGTRIIYQNRSERLEPLDLACALAGLAVRRDETKDHLGGPLWGLHIWSTDAYSIKERTVVRYTGTVWCPTTESGTWLARRNGTTYWTGNSRLAAGILFVPDELSFADEPPEQTVDPETGEILEADEILTDDGIDTFTLKLMEHLSAPVLDRASAASLVPLILRGPAEFGDKVKLIELARELDTWAQELRAEALTRLAKGLDAPPEMIAGKAGLNHWPMASDAQILTVHGWRYEHELVPGERVVALDHSTGESMLSELEGTIRRPCDRQMYRVVANGVDLRCTGDHRWPVVRDGQRLWVPTLDLRPGKDRLVRGAANRDVPTIAKYDDAFVELVAWYSADGTQIGTTPQVRIGKSHKENPQKVAELRRIFTQLFGPEHDGPTPHALRGDGAPRWTIMVEDRGMTLFCPNKAAAAALLELVPGKEKVIPLGFVQDLTRAQLLLFLDAWGQSDGVLRDKGGVTVNQRNERRLDAPALAAVLAGRPIGYSTQERTTGFAPGTQHYLNVPNRYDTVVVKNVEAVDYEGDIWCPRVPVGTSVLARDPSGAVVYTGQTAYNVDVDFIVRHVQPLGSLLADFLTFSYLRPMLEEYEDVDPTESQLFRISFDLSSILARQDESASARDLHSRDAVSDETLLRSAGFDSTDAPSDEELFQRRAWKLVVGSPGVFAQALLPLINGFAGVDVSLLQAGNGAESAANPETPDDGVKDANSGQGEPESERPGFRQVALQLATAADAALDRALEKAGARVVTASRTKRGEDLTMRDRLKAVDKATALTLIGPKELQQLGLSTDRLFEGAWDHFSLRSRMWLRTYLEADGMDALRADDMAATATSVLVTKMQEFTIAGLHRGFRIGQNGLRLPDDLVLEVLAPIVAMQVS